MAKRPAVLQQQKSMAREMKKEIARTRHLRGEALESAGLAAGSPLNQLANIPHIDFMSDLTGRFRMLGMRWKALDRAMNLS